MTGMSATRKVRAQNCPEIDLKIASTRAEREAAFRLIYHSYVRAGLCEVHASGLRVTRYQLQRSTDILIAKLRGEVIGTLSLVHDDRLGLPMEQVYADEVAERRGTGLRLAEISCLAYSRTSVAQSFSLYCGLYRLMVQLAQKLEIDQLLNVVHLRHVPLYLRYLAFQQIGDNRDYPEVRGRPAVALGLDLKSIETRRHRNCEQFIGTRLPASVLCPQPISPEDVEYFESLLSRPRQPGRWEDDHSTQGPFTKSDKVTTPVVTMGGNAVTEDLMVVVS